METRISLSRSSTARRLAILGVGAVFAFAFSFAVNVNHARVAHAAACYGGSCVGLDPNGTGCNDSRAYTVSYAPVKNTQTGATMGWVYEIYSPDCVSNWTYTKASAEMNTIVPTAVNCSNYNNPCGGTWNFEQGENWFGISYAWSPMVDGRYIAQSCAIYLPYSGAEGKGCANPV